jgi:hypothetical protein
MRSIIIIACLCFASIAFSQELPPDPNKVQVPPGHTDPDPVVRPANTPTEPNIQKVPNEFQVYNGRHTLYNKSKQKTKEGFFKDNRLCDGNAYIYDDKGKLQRIAIYRNCTFVKDSVISK